MNRTFPFFFAAVATVGMLGHANDASAQKDPLDLSGRDTKINPAQNFFEYANGTWLKNAVIPADKTGWGSFYVVRDQALSNMRTILDSCLNLNNPTKGSVAQQVGDLYASALDSNAINAAGISPLWSTLGRIQSIQNTKDLLDFITTQYTKGNRLLFSFSVSPDDKNSNLERARFGQGGLGLPNKNYYLNQDPKSKEIRAAYKKYIEKIFNLAMGTVDTHGKIANDIVNLETELAKASKTPVELRDPQANYHLMAANEINAIAPNLNWNTLLQQLGIHEDTLLIRQPDFYKGVSNLISSTPLHVWKEYLTFHIVNDAARWLSKPFEEANFDFFSKTLSGQQVPEPRWQRASSLVNSVLGDALGQLYVQKYFPPEAKAYMLNLVHNLQKAYAVKIKEASWLSEATKKTALEKLNAFTLKIGYPDKWKDYSSVDIDRNSLVQNLQNIGAWAYQQNIDKLNKPVDKSEWFMTPPTVNAYYNPSFNEIVFPAGILQPPFYFQHGDDAVNYGGIGYVIGHEMTHGFDDQGSQYDKDGNLKNWWTPEDRKKFEAIAQKVVNQYNHYVVLDSVHVNGKLTLGENMAGIGGMNIDYAAFKLTKQGNSEKKIDGLTHDQRFFMSAAQVWRIKTRPERLLWRINNDPHSPEIYRVNGPMSDMDTFYKTWNVKPGDGMFRPADERVKIW